MQNFHDLLDYNSIFWSRLGWEVDPPRCDENGRVLFFSKPGDYERYARYHADMHAEGVHLHTCILFSGWVGDHVYDYSLTDRTLETLFSALPEDALFIPRVKFNAPMEWSKKYPEELFVYYGGNNDPEYIRPRVGTLEHDRFGFDAPVGGIVGDPLPNPGGSFANQSFASEKWLNDACEALRNLMRHVAQTPYANRIIGWHIAYGVSGETCVWGRFGRHDDNYGDYSRVFHRAFLAWGRKKYQGSDETLKKIWGTLELPAPARRRNVTESTDAFLRKRPCDCIVKDLDEYLSELNSGCCETLCRTVKEIQPNALTGVFYGYILECSNSSYTGWLGLDRLLNSPYVDFMAAPTSYYRRNAGECGGFIAPAQSVALRKKWIDELDIRTYRAQEAPESWFIPRQYTRAVLFRECAKNLAANAGYWWMDLGDGWYNAPDIHEAIREVEEAAAMVRMQKHRSVADVLFVVDELSMIAHSESEELFRLHKDLRREAGLSGVIYDLYRFSDLSQLNLSQYRLIVFCDCPCNREIEFPKSCHRLYTYLDALPDGMQIQEIPGHFPAGTVQYEGILSGTAPLTDLTLPRVTPVLQDNDRILACLADGAPAMLEREGVFYGVLPLLGWRQFRQLAEYCGCHSYAEAPCIVYGDNRFLSVFSHEQPENFQMTIYGQKTYSSIS